MTICVITATTSQVAIALGLRGSTASKFNMLVLMFCQKCPRSSVALGFVSINLSLLCGGGAALNSLVELRVVLW